MVVCVVGLQKVNDSTHWNWSDIYPVTGEGWKLGGEWKPEHCIARYHMAVIIPFRDRDSHLKALLRHLIPILRRQLIHFRIFVVEQVNSASTRVISQSINQLIYQSINQLIYESISQTIN